MNQDLRALQSVGRQVSNAASMFELRHRLSRAAVNNPDACNSIKALLSQRSEIAKQILSGQLSEDNYKIAKECYDLIDKKICEALALPIPSTQE